MTPNNEKWKTALRSRAERSSAVSSHLTAARREATPTETGTHPPGLWLGGRRVHIKGPHLRLNHLVTRLPVREPSGKDGPHAAMRCGAWRWGVGEKPSGGTESQ